MVRSEGVSLEEPRLRRNSVLIAVVVSVCPAQMQFHGALAHILAELGARVPISYRLESLKHEVCDISASTRDLSDFCRARECTLCHSTRLNPARGLALP